MTSYRPLLKFAAFSAVIFAAGMASPAFSESAGHYIDDATITGKVKEAILADDQLKVMQIQVATSHGVVSLSGAVDTKAQEAEALYVASHVDGVTGVTDQMTTTAAPSE